MTETPRPPAQSGNPKTSLRSFAFTMATVIPVLITVNLSGVYDLPLWQCLAAVGIGLAWGAAFGGSHSPATAKVRNLES